MRIGISFDLKGDDSSQNNLPDDWQEEFDSPVTIEAIASVLRGLGHDVVKLGDGRELLERLLADPPDLVFNFAEGQGVGRAREARVPAVLEMLGIPYTGSDPLTLAVTLDKDCAKRLVATAGVRVPAGCCVSPQDDDGIARCMEAGLQFPVILKPAWEGSSKGIRNRCLIHNPDDLPEALTELLDDYQQPILVEEFITGDELTVGMFGNGSPEILGVMRVVPVEPVEHFVYGLEVKRDFRRQVRYECPAPLPKEQYAAVEEAARVVWRTLGCRDVSRIDFRLRDGVPYFLELNPLPGLNPESSDLVIMSGIVGWTYERLIETILNAALTRSQEAGVRSQRLGQLTPGS
jgi:D-alanine-D-alanine ligase